MTPAKPAPADTDVEALIETLRSFGKAYPEDIFGPVTEQEIKDHASLITRNSAAMGRHCAKFMVQAADALAALQAGAARYRLALNGLLERYVALVNSGDCGFWNPENEQCVIEARATIDEAMK